MRYGKHSLVTIIFLIFCFSSAWSTTLKKLTSDIDALINRVDPNINIGIEIKDLTTNKVIYKKNEERYFVPASNLKILTDAAALIFLGPDFHFETIIATDAKVIKQGQLQGNIYLQLSGAPDLSYDELLKGIKQLKKMGIDKINGDFIVQGAGYSLEPYAPGWMVDDVRHSYGAPLSPYILNQNRLDLFINPAIHIGELARIGFADPAGIIKLSNQIRTVKNGKQCRIYLEMKNGTDLLAKGCIGKNSFTREEDIGIKDPKGYMLASLKKIFEKEKISIKGQFKTSDKSKSNLKDIVRISSAPLNHLIAQTLKPSDNLFADSVFLKVGESFFKERATWKNAAKAVKRIITNYTNVELSKATISDGSGLSRYNLISPHQLTSLLSFLYQQFPVSYEFMSALPIGGRDGTLRNRFVVGEQRAMIRAKTGTMLGVLSLAGYVPSKNHHLLAFSMMINNISARSHGGMYKYKQLEDNICKYLMNASLWNKIFNAPPAKQKTLPFQKKLSHDQKRHKYQNKLRSIEWNLRRTLVPLGVAVYRESNTIELNFSSEPQLDPKRLNAIKKALKAYNVWLNFKVTNKKIRQLLENAFPTNAIQYIDDKKINNDVLVKVYLNTIV